MWVVRFFQGQVSLSPTPQGWVSVAVGSCLSGSGCGRPCWGVGVVSLGRLLPALPTFATCRFQEFFQLGRAWRVTLPTGVGRVVPSFVIYGSQGAEEDREKLLLTDKLLQAVFAEAQVVCVCQPLLIAGDLHAPLASSGLMSVVGRVGTSWLVAPVRWLRLLRGIVRWYSLHFCVVADFCIHRWTA